MLTILRTTTKTDRLRWISFALVVCGVGVSGYLAAAKLGGVPTVCLEGLSNCEIVQNSPYAMIGPVPVAVLGLAGYLLMVGVLALENRVALLRRRGKLIMVGLTLVAVLFSAYLTAIEAFVLQSWCQWCVMSAIIVTLLFGVSFVRLWRETNTVSEDNSD